MSKKKITPNRIIGDYTFQLGFDRPDLYEKYSPQAEKWVEEYGDQRVSDALSAIYSIANDLAWQDPRNSEGIHAYMGNAIIIYQEWLKGDKYERIDVNKLDLPSITSLNKDRQTKG